MGNRIIFSLVTLSILLFNGDLLSQGTDSRARDSVLSLPAREREHLQKSPYIYERYHIPTQCYYAAERARRRYRRNLRMDTVLLAMTQDTIPAEVKEVVQACMDKFNLSTMPVEYLMGAYAPSQFLEFDKAKFVMQRFLKEYPQNDSAQTRRKALLINRSGKLSEVWINPDAAASLFKKGEIVEDMGVPVYAEIITKVEEIARDLLLLDLGSEAARRYFKVWNKWTIDEVFDWGEPKKSVLSLMDFTFWGHGIEGTRELIHKEVVPMLTSRWTGDPAYRRQLQETYEARLQRMVLGNAPPLLPKYLFDSTGVVSQERLPRSGRVTVIFTSAPETSGDQYYILNLLKRLHEKFGERDLDIILLTVLKGHFRWQIMESKEQELEALRKYYLEYLKLPVILAVDELRFSKRFDGARIPEEIVWRRPWPTQFAINTGIAIGRDGEILDPFLQPRWWRRAFQVVEQALEQKNGE